MLFASYLFRPNLIPILKGEDIVGTVIIILAVVDTRRGKIITQLTAVIIAVRVRIIFSTKVGRVLAKVADTAGCLKSS